jgi:hypothetical protein
MALDFKLGQRFDEPIVLSFDSYIESSLSSFRATGTNVFLSFDTSVLSNWKSLHAINGIIEVAETQLLSVQHHFSAFTERQGSEAWVSWLRWRSSQYYSTLVCRAHQMRVEKRTIQRAAQLALSDVEKACALLAREVHKAFTGRIASLRAYLRRAKALRALLLRFVARVCLFHNEITLQRRFYLTHGAHPNDLVRGINGRSIGCGGWVPAFGF